MNKYVRLLLIAGSVVILDQVTKAIIIRNIELFHSIPVIEGFFNLNHIRNQGGAFSVFANQSLWLRRVIFLFFPLIVTGLILYLYRNLKDSQRLLSFGLALISGGAIGNLIDRFRIGEVIDFLDFYINDLHWPSFNIADSAISVGITIFIIHIIFDRN